ncbi:MAG TPA: glucosamine-6-phosphate deaminase, partial [Phycisphaerales bacterium]|nr:glucosamine-6-phosphate deaminase [Phycisphaerales bacterium]
MDVNLTPVEENAVQASAFTALYPPTEKIPTIVVENFPSLGKLVAMRFIEWVQNNPGRVISLPTGKTPEHFIKWVRRLLDGWRKPEIQELLKEAGVDPSNKPDISSLHFVQIDEFYPMDSSQQNSFNYYVKKFYIEGFGLDPDKALLIDSTSIGLEPGRKLRDIWPDNHVDLTLRYRQAVNNLERKQKAALEEVDQWCMRYEHRVRELGGIGFFLGGIGPDGHIGFNIKGSDHHSTTRLCPVNYETQAAAATDLGGIETARKCLVITIGLRTITLNPDCTAIIMAAGQAKAGLIAQAIESEDHIRVPASCLRQLPNARFYITRGAAGCLAERRIETLQSTQQVSDADVEEALVNLAVKRNKRLTDLTAADGRSDRLVSVLLEKRPEPLRELAKMVRGNLISRIEKGVGVYKNKCFLHTEPHHDDIV